MEENALRAWHFKQLKWSLQGLATAGSNQPLLFPDYAESADELALHFDHWLAIVRNQYEGELSEAQFTALAAIADKLATISRDGAEFDAELWTDAALMTSAHWADLRALAVAALAAFP